MISGCWVLGFGAFVAYAAMTDDNETTPADRGTVAVTALEQGMCLNVVPTDKPVDRLPVTPCSGPHDSEVVGVFDLPAGAWSSQSTVERYAEDGFTKRLKAYAPSHPTVGLFYFAPSADDWRTSREVTCIVTYTYSPGTGSIRD